MINKEAYEIISNLLGDFPPYSQSESDAIEAARDALMEYEGQFDDICPMPTTHPFKYSDQEK